MRRRSFLRTTGAAGAAALGGAHVSGAADTGKLGTLPRRPYGDTGEHLSVIGFGGMVVNGAEQSAADRVVRDSIEAGVNYFDVAPTYGDAEQHLGPALEPFRKDVFLACKSTQRMAEGIIGELHASLGNMRTDYFDLYQLHALTTPDDIRRAFGPGGALGAVEKARDEGKVRYIGFSAHSVEAAMEALELFPFDSILVPVNFVMWYEGGFGPRLIEYARERGAAVLALKSMAFTSLPPGTSRDERPYPNCWYRPLESEGDAFMGLQFTLSLPVTAAIPPGDEGLYRRALRLAPAAMPLSDGERDGLRSMADGVDPLFSFPSRRYRLVDDDE